MLVNCVSFSHVSGTLSNRALELVPGLAMFDEESIHILDFEMKIFLQEK